jgi:hypothetical protein
VIEKPPGAVELAFRIALQAVMNQASLEKALRRQQPRALKDVQA